MVLKKVNNKKSNSNRRQGKPNILLLHFSGPPLTSGVDNILKDQARMFRKHNYRVEILAGIVKQFRRDIPTRTISKINPRDELVYSVRKELEKGIVSDKYYKLEDLLYKKVKRYLIQRKINICIVHNIFTRYYNLALTSVLSRLSDEMENVKFITWVHDVNFYDDPYFNLPKNLTKLKPWKNLVTPNKNMIYICVSEYLKDNLKSAFKGSKVKVDIKVVPNVHDIPKFLGLSPLMRKFYDDIDGLNAELIASIPVRAVPRKRLEIAIDVAKSLVEKGIYFKLLLTANIDYKRPENYNYYLGLKKQIASNKLENNVFFVEEYFAEYGKQINKKASIPIPELLIISDFMLLTSSLEGFGVPLIEAGLMRCPIFATDIPPFREIGTTNINYFSLKDSPEDIATFILSRLKKFPQSYFYKKVIMNYSMRKIFAKQIIPLIESIY